MNLVQKNIYLNIHTYTPNTHVSKRNVDKIFKTTLKKYSLKRRKEKNKQLKIYYVFCEYCYRINKTNGLLNA